MFLLPFVSLLLVVGIVLHPAFLQSVVFIASLNCLLPGCCAYLDAENAMDPSLAESMGVNTENLLVSSPSSAENLLSVVNTLTRSGAVDVIVVDSVSD